MKRNVGTQFFYLIVVACLFSAGNARGTEIQINVWTNSVSGYWEEPFWSAGAIPGTNQSILFTNAWQALAIGSSTVSSHPESLQVEAVTLAAPANSFDELLLNYAGFDTALVIGRDASAGTNAFLGSLVVKTNSAVVILSSALQVNNYRTNWTERGAFSIGGAFNQGDFAKVTAGFLHVGDIGPGTYNLTNGLVSVSNEYIGGSFGGVFNQFGGYNEAAVEVSAGGEYDLYGGDFGGSVTFRPVGYSSGTFRQFGGTFTGDVSYMIGNYLLEGGVFTSSSLEIPGEFGNPGPNMTGKFLQTGGTNFCQSITLWGDSPREATSHTGTYTLTNGSLFVSGPLWLHGYGYYSQSGGVQTNSGVSVGADGGYSVAAVAGFSLSGGAMMTPGLFVIGGDYGQSGGTNLIFGDLSFSGRTVSIVFPTGYRDVGSFSLSGGTISCSNATVVTDPAGALSQSGGVLQVVNLLAVSGRSWAGYGGYNLSGGQLITRNMSLSEGGTFRHTGGTIVNSGLITFADGVWFANTNETDLGRLVLNVGVSNTTSYLTLPGGVSVIRFGDSSNIAWSNGAILTIDGWNGSLVGGGHHQIVFGNNSSALRAQQVSQIQFHNPDGINGTSVATILPSGEIVPARLLGAQRIPGGLVLTWSQGATLQTATNVVGPYSDVAASSPYTNNFTDARRFFRLRY